MSTIVVTIKRGCPSAESTEERRSQWCLHLFLSPHLTLHFTSIQVLSSTCCSCQQGYPPYHCTVFHLISSQRSPRVQTTLEGGMWYCQLAILPCDYLQSLRFIELDKNIQHLLLPFATYCTGLAILRISLVLAFAAFTASYQCDDPYSCTCFPNLAP